MPVQDRRHTRADTPPRDHRRRRDRRRAPPRGLPQLTAAASKEQDARVLNLVLAVEYTEVAFYERGARAGGLRGELRDYAGDRPGAREGPRRVPQAGAGRRGRAGAAAQVRRQDEGREGFTAAAVKLEDLAVATYNGQAVNLTSASLKAAARIVSVEARHAAWIRSIVGDVPATEATDTAVKEAETRARTERLRLEGGVSAMDFLQPQSRTPTAPCARRARTPGSRGPPSSAAPSPARWRRSRSPPPPRPRGNHDVAILELRAHARVPPGRPSTRRPSAKAPSRGRLRRLTRVVGAVERAHVQALRKSARPPTAVKAVLRLPRGHGGPPSFVQTAVAFEDLGTAAYKGQAHKIESARGAGRGRRHPFGGGAPCRLDSVHRRRAARRRAIRPAVEQGGDASPRSKDPLRREEPAHERREGAAVHRMRHSRRTRFELAAVLGLAAAVAAFASVAIGGGEGPAQAPAAALQTGGTALADAPEPAFEIPVPRPSGRRPRVHVAVGRAAPRRRARDPERASSHWPARGPYAGGHDEPRARARPAAERGRRPLDPRAAPDPPQQLRGWVPRAALGGYGPSDTHLIVDLRRPARPRCCAMGAAVFRARRSASAPARSPTPRGRFYIRNRLTRYRNPIYGPSRSARARGRRR